MSSSLIITLEIGGILGVLVALGAWELMRLWRDKKRSAGRSADDGRPR